MQIVIVGCGKVGYTLADQLGRENHDVVVIDESQSQIDSIKDELDVMGIVGNGASYQLLREAGIDKTDLLIAVTGSDEQNLLCCLIAKRAGCAHAIARVRNPIYHNETEFLRKELGLAMIINPEYEAANEMARIFQFPTALKIDTFANGRVELMHFRIGGRSPLNGEKIANIRTRYNNNILISTVVRGDRVIIPNGTFVLKENDTVSVIGERSDTIVFFRGIGMMSDHIDNALIAGGGKIPFYLAQMLVNDGVDVTIIEKDRARCEDLAEELPEAMVICGDATDQRILEEEGLSQAQGFAALTGLDEENILLSLYVKGASNAKVITKINRINFVSVISSLNLDTIINPNIIMSDRVIRYVRSLKNSENSNVERLYKLEDGKAEALEFRIKESSEITDIPLMDLKIRPNTLICSIYRNGKIIIPSGQDTLQVNDFVVVVLAGYRVSDIREILL